MVLILGQTKVEAAGTLTVGTLLQMVCATFQLPNYTAW